jgi:putative SOS response-associated peptidase YedK
MCVDIGYKSMLGPDGLPKLIPGIKIDRSLANNDVSVPHIQAHAKPACVVVLSSESGVLVDKLSWGFVADFMLNNPEQHKKYFNQLYNARAEKIIDNTSMWSPYVTRRCLLIAAGVYEHQQVEFTSKKIPHYISLISEEAFLIPSVYNPKTRSFAVITRAANELFKEIHNAGPNKHRMPLLVPHALATSWINPGLSNTSLKDILNYELDSSLLRHHTVYSLRTSSPRPDGKTADAFFNWNFSRDDQDQLSLF